VATTTLINEYDVFCPSQTSAARISLCNSGNPIGQLFFFADGAQLQPDGLMAGAPTLNYHLEDFENCAALLRNEKNVYLLYNGSGPGFTNALQTAETVLGT
jgi:hypothetical protein